MRICLVHEEYPEETNFGGIATYQKRMAEEFVALGHKVYVIARGLEKDQHYIENGVEIFRVHSQACEKQLDSYINYRKKVAEVLISLQSKGLDIIEVPDWGAETYFFEPYRKTPLVVRLHTPLKVWLKYNKNNFGDVTNPLLKWEKEMLSNADLITCCSEILKRIICKEFNLKKEQIFVTPNPANLTNFSMLPNTTKSNSLLYIGSLEERKGVCVLAKALNIVFKKYPSLKCTFIGKDTNRNKLNISTTQLIKKIINKKYLKNLEFLGQLPNYALNKYYNESLVAIFPSLFDNFPYVVLEAMATGIHIVGSKNSGMVEMLNDNSSIYKTQSHANLAKKIINKYNESKTNPYNNKNLSRVKELYSSKAVCESMINYYEKTIADYKSYTESKEDLQMVLNHLNTNENIEEINRIIAGVANSVYKIKTKNSEYIIKRYNNNVNFDLSNKLYQIYASQKINVCSPINKELIECNEKKYNIFNYINGKKPKFSKKLNNFLVKILTINPTTNNPSTIKQKCSGFYEELKNYNNIDDPLYKNIEYTTKTYEGFLQDNFINECYLNHGDLSPGNILQTHNGFVVLDFDEASIGPKLYDFAVVAIKFCYKHGKLNNKLLNKLQKRILLIDRSLTKQDFNNAIKFYLCKILLEKFYLHINKKINLFSARQQQDPFEKYFNLLKNLNI